MARKASGTDQLVSARELLRTTKTAAELRATQAVLLPLELEMSIEETAKAIHWAFNQMDVQHTDALL